VLAGLFAVCALLPGVAGATEIRLLSANVFTGVLDGPIKDFERSSGHNVVIVYATAGNIKSRVQSGEPGDVTIVTRPMMDELEKSGKIAPGTRADLARGASKPDISSVDAPKHALLAANSITFPDPSKGGATGVLFTGILERLDLAATMKAKTKFPAPGGFAVELVAKGDAELAIAQPMEALLQPGVEIVGLLPSELQSPPNFTFTIGQMAIAKQPDAARSLIQYLVGPAVQSILKGKGMEPGPGT
jgi:molybdate transport system substrate-binding protein